MNHMAKEHQLYFTNLDEMNRRLVAIGLDEVKESEDKK
jgi:hypothetical protein